jgi:hypothetical protein
LGSIEAAEERLKFVNDDWSAETPEQVACVGNHNSTDLQNIKKNRYDGTKRTESRDYRDGNCCWSFKKNPSRESSYKGTGSSFTLPKLSSLKACQRN